MYRLIYWSTRQHDGIINPYGTGDYTDKEKMERACAKLKSSKDMYRIEMWERIGNWEGEIVVEDWHGNPAHLKLKQTHKSGRGTRE